MTRHTPQIGNIKGRLSLYKDAIWLTDAKLLVRRVTNADLSVEPSP